MKDIKFRTAGGNIARAYEVPARFGGTAPIAECGGCGWKKHALNDIADGRRQVEEHAKKCNAL